MFTADTRKHSLNLNVEKLDLTTYTATFTTDAIDWTEVYAYAWSGEGYNVTEFLGPWPGTQLEAVDGVYPVTFEKEAPEMIVFSNGSTGYGNQTEDFEFVNGQYYNAQGPTTGIFEMENVRKVGKDNFYNLNGQQIVAPRKGINIINGKKMVVR